MALDAASFEIYRLRYVLNTMCRLGTYRNAIVCSVVSYITTHTLIRAFAFMIQDDSSKTIKTRALESVRELHNPQMLLSRGYIHILYAYT